MNKINKTKCLQNVFFLGLCLLLTLFGYAQNVHFKWAKQPGQSLGRYDNQSVAVDNEGNIYTIGYFQDTFHLQVGAGNSKLIRNPNGGMSIFIAKTDRNGKDTWVKQITTSKNNGLAATLATIAVDQSGNIYIGGYFRDTIEFDPGGTSYTKLVAQNKFASFFGDDGYILRLDNSGNLLWAKQLKSGVKANCRINSIATDLSGNAYITGNFSGSVDFDPGSGAKMLNPLNVGGAFAAKLDNEGNLVWAQQIGNGINAGSYGATTAVDSAGNMYIGGSFNGSPDFDPGAGITQLTSQGGSDVFVCKLTTQGSVI